MTGKDADVISGETRGFRLVIASPLGPLVAESQSGALIRLEFSDVIAPGRGIDGDDGPYTSEGSACPVLEQTRRELEEYFAGRRREFGVPIDPKGTTFQRRVWLALRGIPYGQTWSYEQLAASVGSLGGQRAVGGANGANRIAIVVPCHRVIAKRGGLGGYAGGLERKRFLLELEGAIGSPLFGERAVVGGAGAGFDGPPRQGALRKGAAGGSGTSSSFGVMGLRAVLC